jgi:hypothetical protein
LRADLEEPSRRFRASAAGDRNPTTGTRHHLCSPAAKPLLKAACSFGWWLMAGAGLFCEKSTTGWLLMDGLF